MRNKRKTVMDEYLWDALYLRLSREDVTKGKGKGKAAGAGELEDKSYSIQNQEEMLRKHANKLGLTNIKIYIDDGFTGTNFGRPGWIELSEDIEQSRVRSVLVKDLSRLGRNYVEAGNLLEKWFPAHNVRFIAVGDNVDTINGIDDISVPIKNLVNELYARDISKKRKMTNDLKASNGIPIGPPPFGYLLDPDKKGHWIVDPEAARTVQLVFNLALKNYGIGQIAKQLKKLQILRPAWYYKAKGIKKAGLKYEGDCYAWPHSSIAKMLSTQEYCGDVINRKSVASKFFHDKTRYKTPAEERLIFPDVHEPIIERDIFERVQALRQKSKRPEKMRAVTDGTIQQVAYLHKKATKSGENGLFSGLLFCSDCGSPLHHHFNQKSRHIKYYNCSGYNRVHPICESTHHIRADFLEQMVLAELNRLTKYAKLHKTEFVNSLYQSSVDEIQQVKGEWESKLKTLVARDSAVDDLYQGLYEDYRAGSIPKKQFEKLGKKYLDEQEELSKEIHRLRDAIDAQQNTDQTVDTFVKLVRKHSRIDELTPELLNLFVDWIKVYHAEERNGKKVQRIEIHYNCVGTVDVPQNVPFPDIRVDINKRGTLHGEVATAAG